MTSKTGGRGTVAAILATQQDKAHHSQQIIQRIRHVREIGGRILSRTDAMADSISLDEIELDLWCVLWVPELDNKNKLTSWLLNTSWRSELEPDSISTRISDRVRKQLSSTPDLSSATETSAWWRLHAEGLVETCDACSNAATIDALVANLIAMDGLLLNLLSTITRIRVG